MRLGAYDAVLAEGSQVGADLCQVFGGKRVKRIKLLGCGISERHRHRYEVDIAFRDALEGAGLRDKRAVPRWSPARDCRAGRPSVVHWRAVPSRVKEQTVCPRILCSRMFVKAAVGKSRVGLGGCKIIL